MDGEDEIHREPRHLKREATAEVESGREPAGVFCERGTLGWAREQLDRGQRVRRAGWNGKGMYLRLVKASEYVVEIASPNNNDAVESLLPNFPWVGIRTADGKFGPWFCSQTDLLADDWELAE